MVASGQKRRLIFPSDIDPTQRCVMENIVSTEEKAMPRLGTLLYCRIIFLPWSFFPGRHVVIREILTVSVFDCRI